ncbi:MAG: PepSY domain-containing protein [Gammaproteobacteria bacterium]
MPATTIHFRVFLLTVVILLLGMRAATADWINTQPDQSSDQHLLLVDADIDEIRRLKEAGSIMPLEDIIVKMRRDYPGRIIEIELDEDDGLYVYEIEYVDDDGMVWDLELDARNGELLKREIDD